MGIASRLIELKPLHRLSPSGILHGQERDALDVHDPGIAIAMHPNFIARLAS